MFTSVIGGITGPIANVGPVAAPATVEETAPFLQEDWLNGIDGIQFDMDIWVWELIKNGLEKKFFLEMIFEYSVLRSGCGCQPALYLNMHGLTKVSEW